MKALKFTGQKFSNMETALDVLGGVSRQDDFIFGYVDHKTMRVVYFFKNDHKEEYLPKGVQRITVK